MTHAPEENITRACFICTKEANDALGSAWNIYWLCPKHFKEIQKEERILQGMIGIQALRNVQRKFLSES